MVRLYHWWETTHGREVDLIFIEVARQFLLVTSPPMHYRGAHDAELGDGEKIEMLLKMFCVETPPCSDSGPDALSDMQRRLL